MSKRWRVCGGNERALTRNCTDVELKMIDKADSAQHSPENDQNLVQDALRVLNKLHSSAVCHSVLVSMCAVVELKSRCS